MKELYIAPEVKLIGFVASEKIAASGLQVSLGNTFSLGGYTSIGTGDVKIPLI